MNTKILMVATSIFLGLAGGIAQFLPHEILATLNLPQTEPLPAIIQLAGALYLGFAFTNWTAKDSTIGGVYSRPITMGNFTHFLIGALTLLNVVLSDQNSFIMIALFLIYSTFALIFGWLIYFFSGLSPKA